MVAGSLLGYKHDDEAKKKISDATKGENNPCFGRTGENHPMYGKARPAGAGSPSQQIEVTDLEEKTTTTFGSIGEAARALNIRQSSISLYISSKRTSLFNKRYLFKKIGS